MQPDNTIEKPFVFAPSDLLIQFRNSLHSVMTGQLLTVSGFYNGTGKEDYGGFFYDQLSGGGETTNKLTIKVPEGIRANLKNDGYYTFKGFLEKGALNGSSINANFRVLEVAGFDKTVSRYLQKDFDLISDWIKRGIVDIKALLTSQMEKGIKPPILIITGNESIVDQDFKQALGDTYGLYDFFWIRSRLGTPEALIEAVKTIRTDNPPLLAFMRGGGSGLEVFDNMTLCETVFQLSIPFVTAIGHHVNEPLLQKIADKRYSTPTAFGNDLRELAMLVSKRAKAVNYLSSELEKARDGHKKEKRLLYYVIVGITILLVLVLLFK